MGNFGKDRKIPFFLSEQHIMLATDEVTVTFLVLLHFITVSYIDFHFIVPNTLKVSQKRKSGNLMNYKTL